MNFNKNNVQKYEQIIESNITLSRVIEILGQNYFILQRHSRQNR